MTWSVGNLWLETPQHIQQSELHHLNIKFSHLIISLHVTIQVKMHSIIFKQELTWICEDF